MASSLTAGLSALSVSSGQLASSSSSHHHQQHHGHHHHHHNSNSSSAVNSNSNHDSGNSAVRGYDWENEENLAKWRGLFAQPMEKVLRQVHPGLVAQDDALQYVEDLILHLLSMLTARPIPLSVADIECRVSKTFPTPIDKWALNEAQTALEKGKKKSSLVFPVEKVHPMLKEVLQNKVDEQVTLYLVAVLEYISADILKVR